MKNRHPRIRKAAILVASLDHDSAEMLLGQMSSEHALLVRQAMAKLGEIDPVEQTEVIEEFFRIGPLMPARQPAGIELDSRLARQLSLPTTPAFPLDEPSPRRSADVASFRFLHDAEGEVLAPFLQREHPQTIAVVVSHLPPDRAADVLASLPSDLQAEVARRLVDLEDADPEIIREVERALESWLSRHLPSRRRKAGVAALSSILDAAGSQTKSHILANLAQHDRQLAGKLASRPPAAPITFADLAQFDDVALTTVLHRADTEVMILALAGANSELVERVLRQLPVQEAKTLRYALDHLGPTCLSDVEDAQRELANLAQQLQQSGQLPGSPRRSLSLAI